MFSGLKYKLDELFHYRTIYVLLIIFNSLVLSAAAYHLIALKNYRVEITPGEVNYFYKLLTNGRSAFGMEGECERALYYKNWQIDPSVVPYSKQNSCILQFI